MAGAGRQDRTWGSLGSCSGLIVHICGHCEQWVSSRAHNAHFVSAVRYAVSVSVDDIVVYIRAHQHVAIARCWGLGLVPLAAGRSMSFLFLDRSADSSSSHRVKTRVLPLTRGFARARCACIRHYTNTATHANAASDVRSVSGLGRPRDGSCRNIWQEDLTCSETSEPEGR